MKNTDVSASIWGVPWGAWDRQSTDIYPLRTKSNKNRHMVGRAVGVALRMHIVGFVHNASH